MNASLSRRRVAVVVAGGDVERVALRSIAGLDQTGAPDGPQSCVPAAFFFVGFGSSDGVGLPDLLAGRGIERDQAAAELAALDTSVSAPGASSPDATGTYSGLVERRRSGDSRAGNSSTLVFHTTAPVAASTACTCRPDRRRSRASRGRAGPPRPTDHRCSHAGARRRRPSARIRSRVQRIDHTGRTADEDAAAHDRRLRRTALRRRETRTPI